MWGNIEKRLAVFRHWSRAQGSPAGCHPAGRALGAVGHSGDPHLLQLPAARHDDNQDRAFHHQWGSLLLHGTLRVSTEMHLN